MSTCLSHALSGGKRTHGRVRSAREIAVRAGGPCHTYDAYAPTKFNAAWNAMRIDEAWLTHRIALQP